MILTQQLCGSFCGAKAQINYNTLIKLRFFASMAERVGFEPTIPLQVCRISSAVHSTTLPPLRMRERLRCALLLNINGRADKRNFAFVSQIIRLERAHGMGLEFDCFCRYLLMTRLGFCQARVID